MRAINLTNLKQPSSPHQVMPNSENFACRKFWADFGEILYGCYATNNGWKLSYFGCLNTVIQTIILSEIVKCNGADAHIPDMLLMRTPYLT